MQLLIKAGEATITNSRFSLTFTPALKQDVILVLEPKQSESHRRKLWFWATELYKADTGLPYLSSPLACYTFIKLYFIAPVLAMRDSSIADKLDTALRLPASQQLAAINEAVTHHMISESDFPTINSMIEQYFIANSIDFKAFKPKESSAA